MKDDDHVFTLGIEEEFQIIEPETRELRSHVQEMLEEGKLLLKERVKPEMHQSVIEVGTGICANVEEVRKDVTELRREIIGLAKRQGMRVASAGTHPFSSWEDQAITPTRGITRSSEELQLVARSNLIFGLHVHVGISDRALAFEILNEARYFLLISSRCRPTPLLARPEHGVEELSTKVFDAFPGPGSRRSSRRPRSSTSLSASS